jgi:3-hydroxyisobutyrate dehydrogenase
MSTPPSSVAVIGLGNMGRLMLARLTTFERLSAFDIEPAARQRATDLGATVGASAAEAADGADVVVLSLPRPNVVAEVADEVLGVLAPGSVIVDTSTGDPELARRLAAAGAERGVAVLDTPVSGGVMGAADGSLTVMAGGDADGLERARPVLDRLGTRVVHVGGPGAGQVAKLCNNVVAATTLAGMAEAFATARGYDVDRAVIADVLATSSGGNWILEHWLPSTAFADDYDPRFSLDLMFKDIGLFADAAERVGLPTPVAQSVRQAFQLARAQGLGARDMTAIVAMYDGLSVSPRPVS